MTFQLKKSFDFKIIVDVFKLFMLLDMTIENIAFFRLGWLLYIHPSIVKYELFTVEIL